MTDTDRNREKQTEIDRNIYKLIEKDRTTETEGNGQKRPEKDRNRHKWTESDRNARNPTKHYLKHNNINSTSPSPLFVMYSSSRSLSHTLARHLDSIKFSFEHRNCSSYKKDRATAV